MLKFKEIQKLNEAGLSINGKAYPKFNNVIIAAGGAGSGKGFVETKQQFQDVTAGMTPAKVMQAALVSENRVEYSGPVYERILSYSMRAIDSIQLDAIDSAVGVMNDYTGTYKDIVVTVVDQQIQTT